MNRLSSNNLPEEASLSYDKTKVTAGIVHFGVGNFHRTHQAIYCDKLLSKGETEWGITGVSMRSPGIRNALAPQDFLYTQITLGTDTTFRLVGAIQEILVAPENPAAVIDAVADNQTQLVTTTITEKGYCLSSGELDSQHPGIIQDLGSLEQPQTIYGYLAAAIIKRCQNNGTPFTVLCCDNMQGGGDHLKEGVRLLLQAHASESQQWTKENVAFSSSMVDRVSPATDENLKQQVANHWGVIDEWPVAAEPFSQWVIEDNFAGQRAPFDKVDAQFVGDIAPYEQMKLRCLNAGHSMISSLGYLAGDRTIQEALSRPSILHFVRQALVMNVLPATQIPTGSDGMAYIQQLLDRFQNSALPYTVLQVGSDSSQKIQQRWFPSIDDALNQGSDTSYLAFALAAWTRYIVDALDREDLNDPLKIEFSEVMQRTIETPARPILALAGADKFHFFHTPDFLTGVKDYYRAISTLGIEGALANFLESEREN